MHTALTASYSAGPADGRRTWVRRAITAAGALAAAAMLASCAGPASSPSAEEEPELSPQEQLEHDAGVVIEPGSASCAFNNALDEHEGDGSGVSPFGEFESATVEETEDAYTVTFTGEFFDAPEALADLSKVSLQLIFSGAEIDDPNPDTQEPSPTLLTEYISGELDLSGTFEAISGDMVEQETGAEISDGSFSATYPKTSPHFDGFTPGSWVANVSLLPAEEAGVSGASIRCGDGRNWRWEPLSE